MALRLYKTALAVRIPQATRLTGRSALQVRQHSPHAGGIGFINNGHLAKIPTLGGAFVFEQVALKSFAAHDFASAASAKTLGSGAPGFKFGHEYISSLRHSL
jgi:hypothetical protein